MYEEIGCFICGKIMKFKEIITEDEMVVVKGAEYVRRDRYWWCENPECEDYKPNYDPKK